MTLTGILKNILLVVVSVVIWRTPITALQSLGYSIALAGLACYSLGGWGQVAALSRAAWLRATGTGVTGVTDPDGDRPARLPSAVRRALVLALAAVAALVLLLGGLFWSPAVEGRFGGAETS